MRLIQFEDRAGQRRVGVVEGAGIQVLRGVRSTRELGLAAIRAGSGLHDEVQIGRAARLNSSHCG